MVAALQVPETLQHDDLHMANVYDQGGRLRLLDWGDASISHPLASLVVTFRFLEERNRLAPDDHLAPAARPEFDRAFRVVLWRALAMTVR